MPEIRCFRRATTAAVYIVLHVMVLREAHREGTVLILAHGVMRKNDSCCRGREILMSIVLSLKNNLLENCDKLRSGRVYRRLYSLYWS
jgi:hypothetical protein